MIIKVTTLTVQCEYYDTESTIYPGEDMEERVQEASYETSSEEHRIILSREIVNELFD